MSQRDNVFLDLTVWENLRLAAKKMRRPAFGLRLQEVLAIFPELAPQLHMRTQDLSGGQRQLLSLAGATMVPPRLLLLDELSSGVEYQAAIGVQK